MINPNNVPPIADDELLARFVTQSRQFRPSDQTVKPEAFIPHPHRELSVTRHLLATEAEILEVGTKVAQGQSKPLYVRADLFAAICRMQQLRVDAVAIEGNPNHADISGWPVAKQDQKAIALQLAAAATFIRNK